MRRLYWESFSFGAGIHTYHEWQRGGEIFAHDMRNLRADENAYLRLRQPTTTFVGGGVRGGESVSGVFGEASRWWYLDGNVLRYQLTDESVSGLFHQVRNTRNLLAGRIWVVSEFRDFAIFKSEGEERGFWIDLRDDTDNIAYPLGIDAPVSTFTHAPNVNADERLITGYTYVFRLSYVRDFSSRIDILEGNPSAVPELFEGAESNLGPAVVYYVGNAVGSITTVRFVDKDNNELMLQQTGAGNNIVTFTDLEQSADTQVTGIKLYQSEALTPGPNDIVNVDNLQYRLVDYRARDDSNQALGVNARSVEDAWSQQQAFVGDNSVLPERAFQVVYYNDLVFAAVGDELRYSDVRDGGLVQWAWPEANSIRVEGEVLFCVEHRGVLMFGGSHGVWRLSGTDEYNFTRDQLSAIGPVSRGAWARFENTIGFVGTGGFYVTDGVEMTKVSSPHLDSFFEENEIIDGSVTFLPNADQLWSVQFSEGNLQFLRSVRGGWFIWDGVDVKQSTRFVYTDSEGARRERIYYVSSDRLYELLWNDFTPDASLSWQWTSNVIDFKQQGVGESLKLFRWLEVSSSHIGSGVLRVWIDDMDPFDVSFMFVGETKRPIRVPINRRGERIQFKISGVGDCNIRYLRLVAETRTARSRH